MRGTVNTAVTSKRRLTKAVIDMAKQWGLSKIVVLLVVLGIVAYNYKMLLKPRKPGTHTVQAKEVRDVTAANIINTTLKWCPGEVSILGKVRKQKQLKATPWRKVVHVIVMPETLVDSKQLDTTFTLLSAIYGNLFGSLLFCGSSNAQVPAHFRSRFLSYEPLLFSEKNNAICDGCLISQCHVQAVRRKYPDDKRGLLVTHYDVMPVLTEGPFRDHMDHAWGSPGVAMYDVLNKCDVSASADKCGGPANGWLPWYTQQMHDAVSTALQHLANHTDTQVRKCPAILARHHGKGPSVVYFSRGADSKHPLYVPWTVAERFASILEVFNRQRVAWEISAPIAWRCVAEAAPSVAFEAINGGVNPASALLHAFAIKTATHVTNINLLSLTSTKDSSMLTAFCQAMLGLYAV